MFKKLKQKLEEGDGNGLEKVTFSPSKLPGSIVRSNGSHNGDKASVSEERGGSVERELVSNYQVPHSEDTVKLEQERGELPDHLTFHPSDPLSYQSILEGKVKELERECSHLNSLLLSESERHVEEMASIEGRLAERDGLVTELKMQVVECELERDEKLSIHTRESKELEDKLRAQEEAMETDHTHWTNQMSQLKCEMAENDKRMIESENKCSLLEKKVSHLESQLKGYEKASEDTVVNRLHYEVADVEQRVQSRNLEIQILERRLAAQAREKEGDVERLLDTLEELERRNRDMAGEVKEGKIEKRQLLQELEKCRQTLVGKEREGEGLVARLSSQIKEYDRVSAQLDHLQLEHTKQLQERDTVLEEKNNHIKDLLSQLKQSKGESLLSQPLPRHPPGVARRTTSIGIQTCLLHETTSQEIAVLSLNQEEVSHDKEAEVAAGPANMNSLSSQDALEVMKQQQSQLEGELAEKNKIIKVQQQKIMDIRKELRLQKPSEDKRRGNSTPSPPPSFGVADVNFQYLKHVVIRFMCCREDEALQLIRAVSTLLEFSPQEEQHVKNYLSYKMSWFGVSPPSLFTPIQTSH